MSALYVAGFFALFGESTATTRLSGILLAVLTLPLFWFAGRKLDSPAAGVWAALFYASAGLVLWDARRPEYFQPALFLMMVAFVSYLLWRERPTLERWIGVVVCVALGCMVDWMVYLFGAALALHLGLSDRKRHWLRSLGLLAVLAASFGVFLLHVRWAAGSESWTHLGGLLHSRVSGPSRLTAVLVLLRGTMLLVGVAATSAALGALALPAGMNWTSRGVAWTLVGYGLVASQFFLAWTVDHLYVAAWFVFPAIVLIGGMGAARLTARISSAAVRRGAVLAILLAAVGQGTFVAAYRHLQTTWYVPDQEICRVLRQEVPKRAWVATPLRPLYGGSLVTYEMDCHMFCGVDSVAEVEAILHRAPGLYVLLPRPESDQGFWKDMGDVKRKEYGVRRLAEDWWRLLEGAERREAGAYDIYVLRPRER